MKIRNLFTVLVAFTAILGISGVASAIDIDYIDIGTGDSCFNFSIFADPQYDSNNPSSIDNLRDAVDKVIQINNDADPTNDIRFVIVLGDLIQGEGTPPNAWKDENDYITEYGAVKAQLERLKVSPPTGAGIHYIPMTGNHDVWCKFPLAAGGWGYSHNNIFPDYPEEHFADIFDAQYQALSQDLAGWTKQPMPIPNNYPGTQHPPDIYFENFAFDCGPYHFICLDFNARNDSDPFTPTYKVKKFFGYADLHELTWADGTWQWLDKHLNECYKRGIKDVIIFTHHPPIYELDTTGGAVATIRTPSGLPLSFASPTDIDIKGEMHIVHDTCSGGPLNGITLSNHRPVSATIKRWENQQICNGTTGNRIEGDAVFAFNKQFYDGRAEYELLGPLFSNYGINIVHWFSGHYHLKGFNWTDNNIGANVTVIPSVMRAEDIYGIEFPAGTQVRLNEIPGTDAIVTPTKNPNGCFAVVRVNVTDTGPDPSIYSQWDPDVPTPVMWDSPDIRLYENPDPGPDLWGPFIDSNMLNANTDYGVEVRLYNKGCSDASNVEVRLVWADFGSGSPVEYPTGIEVWDGTWISGNVAHIDLLSGAEGKVYFKWTSGGTVGDHFCLIARISHPNDINLNNNKSQENTNVCGTKGGTAKEIRIPVGNPWDRAIVPLIEIVQHVRPGESKWRFTEVYIPERLPARGSDTVIFTVTPPPDTHGQSREFIINLKDDDSRVLLGGVMMKVFSDAPPVLEWAGTPGYTTDGVEPDSGVVNTAFAYKVKYTDEDNDPPTSGYPIVYIFKGDKQIQGSPFAMNEENQSNTDYTDGKIYAYSIALTEPGDDYTYVFWARDKLGVPAEGPATNLTSGPLVKIPPVEAPCLTPLGLLILAVILLFMLVQFTIRKNAK